MYDLIHGTISLLHYSKSIVDLSVTLTKVKEIEENRRDSKCRTAEAPRNFEANEKRRTAKIQGKIKIVEEYVSVRQIRQEFFVSEKVNLKYSF